MRVEEAPFNKDNRHFFLYPAGGGTCSAAYSCACAWQLQLSQENPPFCSLVFRHVEAPFEKDNRHFFLFLRQVEGPAARHTAAHAPDNQSLNNSLDYVAADWSRVVLHPHVAGDDVTPFTFFNLAGAGMEIF
jgi:hypothetical protein